MSALATQVTSGGRHRLLSRDFSRLWSAAAVSAVGDGVTIAAEAGTRAVFDIGAAVMAVGLLQGARRQWISRAVVALDDRETVR